MAGRREGGNDYYQRFNYSFSFALVPSLPFRPRRPKKLAAYFEGRGERRAHRQKTKRAVAIEG